MIGRGAARFARCRNAHVSAWAARANMSFSTTARPLTTAFPPVLMRLGENPVGGFCEQPRPAGCPIALAQTLTSEILDEESAEVIAALIGSEAIDSNSLWIKYETVRSQEFYKGSV